MKSILILTDFSKSATNAIHYAMRFFESESCVFYLMHVHKAGTFISDDLMTSPTENIYESFTKEPKRRLKTLINDLKKMYPNPKHFYEVIVDFDVFTDAVKQAINQHSIDYVVIGSNGQTGAAEVIFGSNTINVIRQVFCKTLVVPAGYDYKPISNFLLPLQSDDTIENEELGVINNFVNTFKLKLHVLRVGKKDDITQNLADDQDKLKDFDCTYATEEEATFYEAVTNYLKTNTIDMTGLIVHDKSFIQRLFTESPTIELSKVIKLPLMIFHSGKN
ncbi:universal stress protein [Psychroserpens mesophilus]|uniref:universal stress protein n=1 Tax=Psychroserpens mesophilus TaxID=325473 RepID=UPI000694D709|nr:universal stress protein [Psychroserpens mesophilus]